MDTAVKNIPACILKFKEALKGKKNLDGYVAVKELPVLNAVPLLCTETHICLQFQVICPPNGTAVLKGLLLKRP